MGILNQVTENLNVGDIWNQMCIRDRYIIEKQTLAQVAHIYEQDGQMLPYSTAELQRTYGLKMMDVKEGLSRFMQRTGLRLNEAQLSLIPIL